MDGLISKSRGCEGDGEVYDTLHGIIKKPGVLSCFIWISSLFPFALISSCQCGLRTFWQSFVGTYQLWLVFTMTMFVINMKKRSWCSIIICKDVKITANTCCILYSTSLLIAFLKSVIQALIYHRSISYLYMEWESNYLYRIEYFIYNIWFHKVSVCKVCAEFHHFGWMSHWDES